MKLFAPLIENVPVKVLKLIVRTTKVNNPDDNKEVESELEKLIGKVVIRWNGHKECMNGIREYVDLLVES